MFGAWGTSNTNTTNNQAQPSTGGFGTSNAFGQPAQNTGQYAVLKSRLYDASFQGSHVVFARIFAFE
jgi:hypothetical protein